MARRSWVVEAVDAAPSSSSSSCGGSSATSTSSSSLVTERGELQGDRRTHVDRREHGGSSDRRGRTRSLSPLQYVLRSLAAVVLLVGIIIFTVRHTRPVYATRGT